MIPKFRAFVKVEHKMCEVTVLTDEGAFCKGAKSDEDTLCDDLVIVASKEGRFCKFDEIELMQCSTLLDKDKNDIYVGDIVEGYKERVKSDYVPKKYPQDRIKVICEVVFERGQFCTKLLRNCDEHKDIPQDLYRCYSYWLDPSYKGSYYLNSSTGKWDLEVDSRTCRNVKKIGNKYENPELLSYK